MKFVPLSYLTNSGRPRLAANLLNKFAEGMGVHTVQLLDVYHPDRQAGIQNSITFHICSSSFNYEWAKTIHTHAGEWRSVRLDLIRRQFSHFLISRRSVLLSSTKTGVDHFLYGYPTVDWSEPFSGEGKHMFHSFPIGAFLRRPPTCKRP